MKILFVHQNMPGQYRELIAWLAARVRAGAPHRLAFLTQRERLDPPEGVVKIPYRPHHVPKEGAYGLSKVWEEATGVGFGAAQAARDFARSPGGWTPDLIVGHTGWGELLFMKQAFPGVPIVGFFEYFYRPEGGPVGFDPDEAVTAHTPYLLHARNAVPFANLHVVDQGHAPTRWQAETFPPAFRDRMYVCHDGIRTDVLRPDPDVTLGLGRLDRPLTRADEVVTFMARNLERTRGFHVFMRALPRIMAERPGARALIVGGNAVSYGKKSTHPGGFRAEMEAEVGSAIDWERVHFLGQVPYADYQRIVQLSRCHLYLTMPFVMSWSLLESMAMGATIVASDVAPVREAIAHGETGLLVDFFDAGAIAAQVIDVLARPAAHAHLGPAARAHVVATYDFETVCLPEHLARMNALVDPSKGHLEI
ncbi:MAG: glycosyltransferase [Shimia sp.]